MLYYETPHRIYIKDLKKSFARFAIITGIIFLFAGVYSAFAAQVGIGLSNQLKAHNHRTSSDGGVLQGLSPVGTFLINTNNAGNLTVSSLLAGSIFMWQPQTASFFAGSYSTRAGAYAINRGSYTFNIGSENIAQAHYSGILGYGNGITGFRYNSFILGNYIQTTANNAISIGNGSNLYTSVNSSTNTIKFYNVSTLPAITIANPNSYTVTGNVGIGTETPAEKLDVAGNVNAQIYYGNGAYLSNLPTSSAGLFEIINGNLVPTNSSVLDTYWEIANGNITPS